MCEGGREGGREGGIEGFSVIGRGSRLWGIRERRAAQTASFPCSLESGLAGRPDPLASYGGQFEVNDPDDHGAHSNLHWTGLA